MMIKKIFKIIRRIIVSALFLYGYNVIALPIDVNIPINIINISLLTLLGIPALFALIFINIVIF